MIFDIYYGQSRISVTDWAARTKRRLALAGLLGQLSVCRLDYFLQPLLVNKIFKVFKSNCSMLLNQPHRKLAQIVAPNIFLCLPLSSQVFSLSMFYWHPFHSDHTNTILLLCNKGKSTKYPAGIWIFLCWSFFACFYTKHIFWYFITKLPNPSPRCVTSLMNAHELTCVQSESAMFLRHFFSRQIFNFVQLNDPLLVAVGIRTWNIVRPRHHLER